MKSRRKGNTFVVLILNNNEVVLQILSALFKNNIIRLILLKVHRNINV